MNNVTNVRPHPLAMTDRAGTHAYFKNGQGSGIVRGKEGGEPLTVETISLDGFVFSEGITEVGFLNMDCEGAELLVFRGGLETLQKHAPRIFCEIHHEYLSCLRQSVHDIVEFLHALGYRVVPMSVESLGEDVTVDQCTHVYAAKDGSMPPPWRGATGAAHAHAPS